MKTQTSTNNRFKKYQLILKHLSDGLSPSQISERLSIPKQTIQYYLTSLKQAGSIRKLGYGTWEVLKSEVPRSTKKTLHIGTLASQQVPIIKPDKIRGHGFMFTVKIPKLKNWDKRASLLEKRGITFKSINKLGNPQSLVFKGKKILLYSNSIIIHEPASYLSDNAQGARNHAVADLLSLITSLETLLHTSFHIHGTYQFKVSRHHYSMMKNALAKQYDQEGRKLQVYNSDGLWFLIDNSFNFHEAETVHPKTSDMDMDKRVLPFFNGLKEVDGFTPQFVLEGMAQQTKNLDSYAVHLKAHVESVQELGRSVRELTEVVKKLNEVKK